MITNLKCPCGDFRPGDPSDAHSVVHTHWLHRAEPGTSVLGESTSARLRRVEQELAAEQDKRSEVIAWYQNACNDLARAEQERDELGVRLARADRELVSVRAELVSARTELDQHRYSGWCVARDGGRTCTACDQEIRRGEAYTNDTTRDVQRHVHCPEGDTRG